MKHKLNINFCNKKSRRGPRASQSLETTLGPSIPRGAQKVQPMSPQEPRRFDTTPLRNIKVSQGACWGRPSCLFTTLKNPEIKHFSLFLQNHPLYGIVWKRDQRGHTPKIQQPNFAILCIVLSLAWNKRGTTPSTIVLDSSSLIVCNVTRQKPQYCKHGVFDRNHHTHSLFSLSLGSGIFSTRRTTPGPCSSMPQSWEIDINSWHSDQSWKYY